METPFTFKILLIGEKGVGRTSFLKRLNSPYFFQGNKEIVGVDFSSIRLDIEGQKCNLIIWNIYFQERFKILLPNHIVGSNGVVLMFDLSNLKTLYFLSTFIDIIKEKAGDVPILLVGNKNDLDHDRQVSKEEGLTFVKDNKLIEYLEISTNTGLDCEKIFEFLTRRILTKYEQVCS